MNETKARKEWAKIIKTENELITREQYEKEIILARFPEQCSCPPKGHAELWADYLAPTSGPPKGHAELWADYLAPTSRSTLYSGWCKCS